jgi:hypothetical protein
MTGPSSADAIRREADLSPGLPAIPTTSKITWGDRWDHVQARLGFRRSGHRREPGLYSLGSPGRDSPVFVTANYTLSFDALRASLSGVDCHIVVLDTYGINVWCAAGGGLFSTEEVIRRVESTSLSDLVDGRVLILPQLSAPGVSAREVRERTGFRVEFGPVRAGDLPAYLDAGKATPEMRRVRFPLRDRLQVVPVEVVHYLPVFLVLALVLLIAGGSGTFLSIAAWMGIASALAGVALFPVVLPWVPTTDFSAKGYILGAVVLLPFVAALLTEDAGRPLWVRGAWGTGATLIFSTLTAYLALNFTGSTTYTSRTGVRREIFRYIPVMAGSVSIGILVVLLPGIIAWLGGS